MSNQDIVTQQQAKVYAIFYNMLKTAITDLAKRDCDDCMKVFLDQMVSNKTISEYNIYSDHVTFVIHSFYVGVASKEESIDI
jgi:hypothetical protein